MREVVVHGSLPHPQGELGLPLPLRGPDIPVLQIVLVPGPERLPCWVAELGNGVCHAQVELDVGLDCQLALLCAVHAVLRVTFSWSRITTAVPYLVDVKTWAQQMFDELVNALSRNENLTEDFKATNPGEWVRKSNNIRNRANEIVNAEVIFSIKTYGLRKYIRKPYFNMYTSFILQSSKLS